MKAESHETPKKSRGKKQERKPISGLPYHSDIITITLAMKLSANEALLLHTLRAGMNANNRRNWRAQKTLAAEMGGVHRMTANRAVKRLEEKGLIKVERDELGKAKAYRINFPWPVDAQSRRVDAQSSNPMMRRVAHHDAQSSRVDAQSSLNEVSNEVKEVIKTESLSSNSEKPDDEDEFKIQSYSQNLLSSQKPKHGDDALAPSVKGKTKRRKLTVKQKLKNWKQRFTNKYNENYADEALRYAEKYAKRRNATHPYIYMEHVLRSIYEDDQPDFQPSKRALGKVNVIDLR